MNYQGVKTFQELAETIKEHIDSHRIPCTDVLRGEGGMYVDAKTLSTTDAQLAFIRLKNKFGVKLPVPDNLIELLDSCGDANRKLHKKTASEKPAGKGQKKKNAKSDISKRFICADAQVLFDGKDLNVGAGAALEILTKLVSKFGSVVAFRELDGNSSQKGGSEKIRTAITRIRNLLKSRNVPVEIKNRKGAGYMLS